MNILIIGSLESVFLYEYLLEVVDSNNAISVLSLSNESNISNEWKAKLKDTGIKVIYPTKHTAIFKFIKKSKLIYNCFRYCLVRKYDLIHFFGVPKNAFVSRLFLRCNTRVIVSYLGSDLLRAKPLQLYVQKPLLSRAEKISLATDYLCDYFNDHYSQKYSEKICIVKYGKADAQEFASLIQSNNRDYCKQAFGITHDKIVVFCGYNGSFNQRHLEIIKALNCLPGVVKTKMVLYFHFGYMYDPNYEAAVQNSLNDSGLIGIIDKNYYSGTKLSQLRCIADIMLNLQDTDALSASMIEFMEARAVVIKGDWLSYPDLDEYYLLSVPSIDSVASLVEDIFHNYLYYYEKTSSNSGIVQNLLSWDIHKDSWRKLYL